MTPVKIIISIAFLICNYINSQNAHHFELINKQVWEQFTKAFETSDYELFGSLHSDDLIRVSGNGKRILGKENYIQGYETRWIENKQARTISFRFLERIANEHSGSERGVYKLTINSGTEKEQNYYGKFHVILRKERGIWKILVDYDSSENDTINEESYLNAHPQNDFEKY